MGSEMFAVTRREVLAGAAVVGMAGPAFGQGVTRSRFDIDSPDGAKMIALYAKAVAAMQDPKINYPPQPRSWLFQSYIHAVPINPFDPANSGGLRNGSPEFQDRVDLIYGSPAAGSPQAQWKAAALKCWGTCTHASPYFTTWHRWYMYYFERVVRSMSGDAGFTLPYWNYGVNTGQSLQLPVAFRTASRLFFDDRGLGFADGTAKGPQNVAMNAGAFMPYNLVNYRPALSAKPMFPSDTGYVAPTSPQWPGLGLSGRLESAPHDMVHDNVGGWMGNVPSAAGDPLFYVHHCQVDRLYASWEALQGVSYNWGDTPTQPSEATWTQRQSFFVDETGTLVTVKLGDAVKTSALGYGYDGLARPDTPNLAAAVERREAVPANHLELAAMKTDGFKVGEAGATVTLSPQGGSLRAAAPRATAGVAAAPTVLALDGLTLLRRPPAPLSVFINLPNGVQPRLDDAYYVGTLNLFNVDLGTGTVMAHDPDGMPGMGSNRVAFDVGSVLDNQRRSGLWDGKAISVTITTVGVPGPVDTTYVTFAGASLEP